VARQLCRIVVVELVITDKNSAEANANSAWKLRLTFINYLMSHILSENMAKLSDQCKDHLESALEREDPSEKDFHIRQVLQAGGFEASPE